ncbi:MAG: lytic transglycosylase domain-containing protein, partial [Phocaeicola sp.]
MKNKSQNRTGVTREVKILFMLLFFPHMLYSSCINREREGQTDLESNSTALEYSSFDIPNSLEFCGQQVDLSRYDRRERMDRELLAFTYMHSSSIQMIKRANRFFPAIEPILKEQGIPDDFKYLMVIESNLNPNARSGAGAAGLWQIMPATGKQYKLIVDDLVDERYHLEKSTRAACRYLKEAYAKYGSWVAVAASYNAGQARISKELERQSAEDALDLHLVEETSRYTYRILAAKILFSNPAKLGFRLRAIDLYPAIDYKEVTVYTTIADLANWAKEQGINLSLLKNMNPWLRGSSLTVPNGSSFTIKIPTKEAMYYNPEKTVSHNPA